MQHGSVCVCVVTPSLLVGRGVESEGLLLWLERRTSRLRSQAVLMWPLSHALSFTGLRAVLPLSFFLFYGPRKDKGMGMARGSAGELGRGGSAAAQALNLVAPVLKYKLL